MAARPRMSDPPTLALRASEGGACPPAIGCPPASYGRPPLGAPPQAWRYKLGNRSALEWILDQYKEKTPKDPTIREKFNTYRFADHKEKVIDLLRRVTRVSVETMQIVDAMRTEKR